MHVLHCAVVRATLFLTTEPLTTLQYHHDAEGSLFQSSSHSGSLSLYLQTLLPIHPAIAIDIEDRRSSQVRYGWYTVPCSCDRRSSLRFERVKYSFRPRALVMASTAIHIIKMKARR